MTGVLAVQGYLADGGNSPSDVNSTTGKGPEWGEAAPIGLLVIVLLCVAVYFLVKSMNRNLRKVPESFADVSAPGSADAAGRPEVPTQTAEPDKGAAGTTGAAPAGGESGPSAGS